MIFQPFCGFQCVFINKLDCHLLIMLQYLSRVLLIVANPKLIVSCFNRWWLSPLFFLQKSARQASLLLSCLVNIKHLTVQCWPNLLWGQFNKTLHVMVLKHLWIFFSSADFDKLWCETETDIGECASNCPNQEEFHQSSCYTTESKVSNFLNQNSVLVCSSKIETPTGIMRIH